MKGASALGICAVLALTLTGCERTFRDMYQQPRYKPLAASALWADGRSSRPPVDGTVARSAGTFAGTSSGRLGSIGAEPDVPAIEAVRPELRTAVNERDLQDHPINFAPPDAAQLARGRERFDVFCSPCHSIAGDGDGMVARRGFPHPPSFHTDRLRNAPDSHFYAVITYGYGAMHAYATRVPPADRVAIVGYIRALQLSQHADAAGLSDDERRRLADGTAMTGERR